MASKLEFVEYAAEQMQDAGNISFRMMFGEYIIYCDGKVVALVCDDKLFVKPTETGRAYIGDVVEAPPYPGAKNCFLIEDKLDDQQWLKKLIQITTKELPEPKKKKPKKPKK